MEKYILYFPAPNGGINYYTGFSTILNISVSPKIEDACLFDTQDEADQCMKLNGWSGFSRKYKPENNGNK